MIHLCLLGLALISAWGLQAALPISESSWKERWFCSLRALILPPLWVLATLLAIIWMGPQGEMVGSKPDGFSYGLAWALLGIAGVILARLAWGGWCSLRLARSCGRGWIEGQPIRILESSTPFAAQVGFWQPQLLISRGLMATLSPDHLRAVVIHEQAHEHYRDTFWFFWLGWLRTLAAWLPQTQTLWRELLILRELRADHWAAQRVDPLILAEALLQVVGYGQPEGLGDGVWAAGMLGLSIEAEGGLEQVEARIQALLEHQTPELPRWDLGGLGWLGVALLPLVTIWFHS